MLTKTYRLSIYNETRGSLTAARRTALLNILQNERYLTRSQLIARVELSLGKNCFGTSSRETTLYRDLQAVKQSLKSNGYLLAYSRDKANSGYYLRGQSALSVELKRALRGSVAETDQRQIDIYQRLSPADRFRQGCAISDVARTVVAYRIRLENPSLSLDEANRMALQRAYM
ncbi:MAG: hypothetical protein IT314_16060 [Anaerolineales bacterium]|nr:hypothetical protein [Anaerolineales bacterium]